MKKPRAGAFLTLLVAAAFAAYTAGPIFAHADVCNDMDGDEQASSTLPSCADLSASSTPSMATSTSQSASSTTATSTATSTASSTPGVPNTGSSNIGACELTASSTPSSNLTASSTDVNASSTNSTASSTASTSSDCANNNQSNATSTNATSSDVTASSTVNANADTSVSVNNVSTYANVSTYTPPQTNLVAAEVSVVPFVSFRWTTNEPGTSEVFYSDAGSTTPSTPASMDTSLTTDHFILLTNLNTDTPYTVRVRSVNGSGNEILSNTMSLTVRRVETSITTSH